MDVNTVIEMIGTVGFPIAACCVMFWQNSNLQTTLAAMATSLELMNERISKLEEK